MTAAFCEIGLASSGMSGPVPLSWQEIYAYNCIATGAYSAWSLGVIRVMSEAYCRWYTKGCQQTDIAEDVPYVDLENGDVSEYIERSRKKSSDLRSDI